MDKEPNVYSFADECYVYYGDYKKDLEQKDKEIERLNNIINRGIELLEPFVEIDMCVIKGKMIKPALDKLKESLRV